MILSVNWFVGLKLEAEQVLIISLSLQDIKAKR